MSLSLKGAGKYPAIGGASYTGPGDAVASATAWWGLRGYTAAYSTGSNPALDVVDTATGLITTTINIKADGSLDDATILGLGYAVSVKKMYDQTGGGFHLTQATLATMPTLTQNVVGSLPGMSFNGSQKLVSPTYPSQINQAYTISVIGKRTGNTGAYNSFVGGASNEFPQIGSANSSNTGFIYNGVGVPTFSLSDNAFHAIQALFNSASSSVYVDGTDTGSVDPGSTNLTNVQTFVLGDGNNPLTGVLLEAGLWPSGFSGGNKSSMNSNQHTYWGF